MPLLAQNQNFESGSATNEISLEECLRQAIEHNLEIQISRVDPQIRRYQLDGSYSLYEPRFDADFRHAFTTREGTRQGGQVFFATEETADVGSAGIVGELPTGLQYDIGFSMRRNLNESPLFGTNLMSGTNIVEIGTDSRYDYVVDASVELSQPLLKNFWIDEARANIKLFRHDLKISEYALELNVMAVVRDVYKAYYDLIAAQDEVKVREKALELARQLFDENKARVKAGTMAPLDEKQAESEAAVARADLIRAQAEERVQQNVLKSLLTDNYEKWQSVHVQPAEKLIALPETYDRTDSWMKALVNRPDFNQAKERLERQGVVVKLGYNQLFPTLDIVGGYGRAGFDQSDYGGAFDDIKDNNDPHYYIGGRLSIPLGNRLERNRYKAAKETLKELELNMSLLHQTILISVDNAINVARSSFELIEARREARLFAEAALVAEQKKYANGKSTSFFVLQFQRDLTEARAREINALAEYNKALAQLYYDEGSILERSKINIEVR